jgi:hypothetical protein
MTSVIYHPGMSRTVNLTLVAVSLAMAAVGGTAPANSQPPACGYTLSPPQVVQTPSGSTVTATVTLVDCAGSFRPELSVACVHVAGQDSQGVCAQARGPAVAQAYFQPYQPGATYISSGRGCGTLYYDMLEPNCQPLGPINARL